MKILKAKVGQKSVFTIRDIQSALRTLPVRHGTNSVLTPPDQIASLLPDQESQEQLLGSIMAAMGKVKEYDVRVWRIAVFQFENSLRISEVLSISPYDVDILGNVKINALKGGNDRIVPSGELREFFMDCRKNGVFPFSGISRNYVYRVYKKCGLQWITDTNHNNIVTHIFRHATAAAVRIEGFESSLISSKLGHKSLKTQMHYGKNFTEKEKPTEGDAT